jgi:hypothetical protein
MWTKRKKHVEIDFAISLEFVLTMAAKDFKLENGKNELILQ